VCGKRESRADDSLLDREIDDESLVLWRTVWLRLGEKAKPMSGTPVRRGACSERRTLKGTDARGPRETVAFSTENVP